MKHECALVKSVSIKSELLLKTQTQVQDETDLWEDYLPQLILSIDFC